MPDTQTPNLQKDPVLQLSIFLTNKAGRLEEILTHLSQADVHVQAITVQESTECSVVRIIVNYPAEARRVLHCNGCNFTIVQVVAIEFDNVDQIRTITNSLYQAEINIHYMYAFLTRPNGRMGLVLNVEDHELASSILHTRGLTVIQQSDIAR